MAPTTHKHLFNIPPPNYCASYSSLSYELSDESYPLAELLSAARHPAAVCPHTHFTISTPFKPLQWALRLATRYPSPAAAVTLVKCLRTGVDLGFRGDRTLVQIGPNLQSAKENSDAVTTNITTELEIADWS